MHAYLPVYSHIPDAGMRNPASVPDPLDKVDRIPDGKHPRV
jgi:hypothetical protein